MLGELAILDDNAIVTIPGFIPKAKPALPDGFTGKTYGRFLVLQKHDFRCVYCGRDFLESPAAWSLISMDHLVARCHGGAQISDNRVPACVGCNVLKGGKKLYTIDEARRYVAEQRQLFTKQWLHAIESRVNGRPPRSHEDTVSFMAADVTRRLHRHLDSLVEALERAKRLRRRSLWRRIMGFIAGK